MGSNDNDATATGFGCLIIIAIIWFVGSKICDWFSKNQETVNSGLDTAKRIGLWVLVVVVAIVVMKWISGYRKKIRHSEKNYLSVVLSNHNFEDLMRRAKSLSDNAREVLPEVEKSQLQLEQGLRELRNKGQ